MAVSSTIQSGTFIITRFSGDISEQDFLRHRSTLEAAPGYRADLPELVDLTGVTTVNDLPSRLMEETARWPLHSLNTRRAIIAPQDSVFGLARMHAIYRELEGDHATNVFRSMDEALRYLGLEKSALLS